MHSSFRRRLAAAAAVVATTCAGVLVPVAANAVIVADPVNDRVADAPFTAVPTGTFETGLFDQGASEIVKHFGDRLFSVNAAAGAVFVLDASDPANPVELFQLGVDGTVANSVAVRADGLGVVALENAADKTAPGRVLFFDATADTAEDAVLGTVTVGSLPDMVTVSPDGAYAVVANEGEPADDFLTDPEGSVSVIALPAGIAAAAQDAVQTADFHAFENGALPEGVRTFGPTPEPGNPVSRNLEPEYITVVGTTAYTTLQEANAIAVVDLPSATVTDILPLGLKDWGTVGIDASDKDDVVNIANRPGLKGMYMPDGIASYEAGGQTFLVTANEGDARADWGDYSDEVRVKDLADDGYGPLCDEIAGLGDDETAGRINVSKEDGFDDARGCYSELWAYGGRSFSIWTADGQLVFDSGAQFEQITSQLEGVVFNAGHDDNEAESRSDAKGVEPENLVIGEIAGRTLAFIGLERLSGVMAYDITDPAAPTYVSYFDNRDFTVNLGDEIEALEDAGASDADIAALVKSAGDLGPEGLDFIPASESPSGEALLVTGNEVTGSTTIWTLDDGVTDVQVLTINDFHGRVSANGQEAGAAVVAGAVAQYEAANPNTLFVSAGDNIGASTFTSFIADDEPTIDALSAGGLDLSVVGNHEFDQGFADLTDRVIPRYEDKTGLPGADFALGANVYRKGTTDPALAEYAIREVDGVKVAFIGTVTSDTATLVSPAGIAELEFGDQLEAANRVAAELTATGAADVIVLLTHSGSAGADCAALAAEDSEYGSLVRGASADIDAIVSGHTHQLYACDIAGRPVLQAHQYGTTLGALDIRVDSATRALISIEGSTVDLVDASGTAAFPADADVAEIVAAAEDEAETLGSVPVGKISADILRGGTPAGSDRGVESSMGNLIADMYLWSTGEYENYGGATDAQIALMNPGGLRDDLLFEGDGTVTYADVAAVQPFGNTLVTLTLTGAQLEQVLEEQWQPGAERPKLHLGVSDGFAYEYVDDAAAGDHIKGMTYKGEPIAADDEFVVVTNSFLAAGGDGFAAFAEGTGTADSGIVDLAATVDYFEAETVVDPAPLGRAVVWTPGTEQPEEPGQPGTEQPGAEQPHDAWVTIDLSAKRIAQGDTLQVELTGLEPGQVVRAVLHSEPIVVQGLPAADASGTISFALAIPADFEVGAHTLVISSAGLPDVSASLEVVAGGALAATGLTQQPWILGLIAAALVIGGGVLALRRRRAGMPTAP